MKKFVAALIVWLKGEPVVTSVVAADLATAAAHFGVSLDAGNTLLVGAVASAIAAWAARSLVTPVKST